MGLAVKVWESLPFQQLLKCLSTPLSHPPSYQLGDILTLLNGDRENVFFAVTQCIIIVKKTTVTRLIKGLQLFV